jgi:hypothetical protein
MNEEYNQNATDLNEIIGFPKRYMTEMVEEYRRRIVEEYTPRVENAIWFDIGMEYTTWPKDAELSVGEFSHYWVIMYVDKLLETVSYADLPVKYK